MFGEVESDGEDVGEANQQEFGLAWGKGGEQSRPLWQYNIGAEHRTFYEINDLLIEISGRKEDMVLLSPLRQFFISLLLSSVLCSAPD